MTESVKVYSSVRFYPELFKEVISSRKYLAYEAFAAGDIAVRLEIPTTHYVPFALFYKANYSAEKNGIVLFNPFVKHGFVVAEDEAVIIVAEVCGYAEGRKRFGNAFFYFPKPYGIYMRVAYKVKIVHFIILSPMREFYFYGKYYITQPSK